jgi:phage antirepressor YoqD-like protein
MARALISAQSVIAGKDAIIEAAQPALRLESAISNDDNTLSMTEAGKKLQVKPRMFISWLYQHKYIDGGNMPYQRWINQGLLVISTIEKNGKPRSSTRVTGKGFAYFGGKISEVKFENNQHYLFYR